MSSGRPAASAGISGDGIPRDAWLRLAACAGAAALLQMDGTIVTVALPSVGEELDADSHQLSCVLTAYFVAYGLALFPGGRAGRPHRLAAGRAWPAWPCSPPGALFGALAGSIEVLIASRVVQGVGAGLVSPASLAGAVSGLPGRAARGRARHLGRELRRREPDRPGRGRAADGRDRLARVLVVPDPGERGGGARALAARAARGARGREPRHGGPAPARGGGRRAGRGAHVRGDDRRLLHRPAVPAERVRATRRSARPRR